MAATIAILSNGLLVKRGDAASPEVFTTIPEVMRATLPGEKFDRLDISSHDNPTMYRRFILGFQDGGQVTLEINWRPSNTVHAGLQTDNHNGTLRNFKFVFADTPNNTASFSARVEDISPNGDVGKALTANVRLQIEGPITWS